MCQNCFTATTVSSCDGGVTGGSSKVLKVSKERSPRSSIDRLDSQATTNSRSDRSSNDADPPPPTPVLTKRVVNRCSGCKRKVGLTGFRCRCGELFCSEHRYSDRHVCSYDYKAAGRETIARENPVVKAAKIVRVWNSQPKKKMFSAFFFLRRKKIIVYDAVPVEGRRRLGYFSYW
jgi:hypothetical protein